LERQGENIAQIHRYCHLLAGSIVIVPRQRYHGISDHD
jgi:hypothetical protein